MRRSMQWLTWLLCPAICLLLGSEAIFANGAPPSYISDAEQISRSDSRNQLLQPFKRGDKIYLSLKDCIGIALKQNLDIDIINEKLVQANEDISIAFKSMLPSFGAEASCIRFDEDMIFSFGPASLTFIEKNTCKAGIIVRQPIYMGGRLKANLKATEHIRDAQSNKKLAVQKEIKFQVIRIYHMSKVAEKFHKVASEGVELLKAHEHDVAIMVREGAIPELDLLRTRTGLANAQKDLNSAKNALDLSLSALKNVLYIDLESPIILTEDSSYLPRPPQDLPEFVRLALKQRPEIAALTSRLAAAKEALKAAKGEYLPIIALEGRYEYMEGDFRDIDGDFHWTVGFGAQLPLWNWGQIRSKVRKTKSQVEEVKLILKKVKEGICLEVRQDYLNLGKAEKNIIAAKSAIATAKEAYRLARAGYQAGVVTNTDVLDGHTALLRAEVNLSQALFEYNLALAALQKATGVTIIN